MDNVVLKEQEFRQGLLGMSRLLGEYDEKIPVEGMEKCYLISTTMFGKHFCGIMCPINISGSDFERLIDIYKEKVGLENCSFTMGALRLFLLYAKNCSVSGFILKNLD